MIDFEKTAKLSQKGQVRLETLKDLACSLSQYAKKYIPFEEAREHAWEAEFNEKHSRR